MPHPSAHHTRIHFLSCLRSPALLGLSFPIFKARSNTPLTFRIPLWLPSSGSQSQWGNPPETGGDGSLCADSHSRCRSRNEPESLQRPESGQPVPIRKENSESSSESRRPRPGSHVWLPSSGSQSQWGNPPETGGDVQSLRRLPQPVSSSDSEAPEANPAGGSEADEDDEDRGVMAVTAVTATAASDRMESDSDSDKSSDNSGLKRKTPALKMSVSKRARKASSDLDQASLSPSEEENSESSSESEKTSDQDFTPEKKAVVRAPRRGPLGGRKKKVACI
ncbi:hypothetical protein H8959_015870 [Pygathrix nigripes]